MLSVSTCHYKHKPASLKKKKAPSTELHPLVWAPVAAGVECKTEIIKHLLICLSLV